MNKHARNYLENTLGLDNDEYEVATDEVFYELATSENDKPVFFEEPADLGLRVAKAYTNQREFVFLYTNDADCRYENGGVDSLLTSDHVDAARKEIEDLLPEAEKAECILGKLIVYDSRPWFLTVPTSSKDWRDAVPADGFMSAVIVLASELPSYEELDERLGLAYGTLGFPVVVQTFLSNDTGRSRCVHQWTNKDSL